jgi:hypothetical protein
LLLPLIYIILYICINTFYNYTEYNEVTLFLEGFGFSTGQILTIFVGCIFKYKSNRTKKKKEPIKKFIKNYSILFLIDAVYMLSNLLPWFAGGGDEEEDSSRELFINDAIEIIFLTLITYFFLKYKYYIHHIISIALFVILAIIIDIILENFTHTNTITVINSIIYVLSDSLIYSYFKYLIDSKYYYFLDVLFMLGIINIIIHIISFLIILAVQNSNETTGTLIILFKEYYNEYGIWHMIFRFLFALILIGFCVGMLEFLILDKLTPNYVIIGYELGKIPATLISTEGVYRWIILAISIFQIISLLFYLEIFEYNFCSLNENTKRRISERESKQFMWDNDGEIIYKGYDLSDFVKNEEKEMRDVSLNKEEIEENENI